MSDEVPARPTRRRPASEDRQVLTEDVIKQVTDKVYALLMHDLMIERERYHPPSKVMGGFGGFRDRGGW